MGRPIPSPGLSPGPAVRADLHCHSSWSDGSANLEQILCQMDQAGLDLLALTDHDTVEHLEEALALASQHGRRLVPGVEISAREPSGTRKVHIVGVGLKLPARSVAQFCQPILQARTRRSQEQLEIMISLGLPISAAEVQLRRGISTGLYKQHLMEVLVAKGLDDSVTGRLYQELFKGNGPCRGDIPYPDAREAIRAIRESGGIAVLAHPGQGQLWDILPTLRESGLQALESNHPSHCVQDRRIAEQAAIHHGLWLSGGSDWHGSRGAEPSPGTFLCPAESPLCAQLASLTKN